MTSGAGLDVVEIGRLRRLRARRPEFFVRYFSEAERARAEGAGDPARLYARAFAAKEAFLKAVGHGVLDGIAMSEVELRDGVLRLGARAQAAAGATASISVSVADDRVRAWAIVLVG